MTRFIKNITLSILAVAALSSCRDEIILNLDTMGAIPVIEANISNDSVPFKIRVTTTADYYTLEVPFVSSAFVTISSSDGIVDTLQHDSGGYYVAKSIHPCKPGLSYTLNVNYKGKNYSATEKCNLQNPIDSLKTIFAPKRNFFPEGYYLWEYTTEKPGLGDCYQWNIYRNDTLLTDNFYYLNDDQFVDGNDLAVDYLFPFKLNDKIKFEQMAISRQLYNFLTSVQNQTNRDGSPFSSAPSNIAGNLSNGAMGYFAVRNTIRKQLVAK
jgi:hypothetical protein